MAMLLAQSSPTLTTLAMVTRTLLWSSIWRHYRSWLAEGGTTRPVPNREEEQRDHTFYEIIGEPTDRLQQQQV